MQLPKKHIATVLISMLAMQLQAQQYIKSNIENKFDRYRQYHLQEKIFVHADKNNYASGEICWFKIYNVDAYYHKPLNFSKVAYVEILDNNNVSVLQAKVAVNEGKGNGSFYLPNSIVSGNYRLRAYTNWMKNEGADYFFEKQLSIVNVQKNSSENNLPKKMAYEISFFPEGGNLVNGLESKVGFKVCNQFGKGVNFSGWLLSEKGDTITAFHPLKFGMGNFLFTPREGSTYKAVFNLPDGGRQQKELPAAYQTGYAMRLENTIDGHIKISITTPEKNNVVSAGLFLFIHTRNVVKAALVNTIQNGEAVFIINDTIPGEGISHFTVFSKNGQPLCERLYFKKPAEILNIAATTDHSSYAFRKKVTINIQSKTVDGKSVPANMSMAVYRVDSVNEFDKEDINNYLLLSSDISGKVESPEYYFDNTNDTVKAAIDNLMLTQGWRRFKWEDVLLNRMSPPAFLPEINGHIISGKVVALKQGLPVQNIWTCLSAPGIRTQFQTSTSDKEGNIKFEMKDFYNNGEIIVQTNSETDSLYQVNINLPFFPQRSNKLMAPFHLTASADFLLNMYIESQVQNSFFYDKLSTFFTPPIDTTAFYHKPDEVYLLDNYVRFTTVEEVLREYVPEVLVKRRAGKFNLPVFDHSTQRVLDGKPLVLLDAVPVFNFDKLMLFDALKLRKLEVVSRKYLLGASIFDGIINFTSYKGDIGGVEIDPHVVVIDYDGLQLKREFYSPTFETQEQLLSRQPDFRNLLYWSPDVITGSSGKVQTNFYSSDLPGKYAAVIQGLSDEGRAGSTVIYFEVKKL